jgi:biotin-dependent carboxylase-like uncharacterized protein
MSVLVVEEAGPATSVQDSGRTGAMRFGLAAAGAMDLYPLAAANALVGLPAGAAAIELGPLGFRATAQEGPIGLALFGAARAATVAGKTLALGETVRLLPGETLVVKPARGGTFTYLAIEGGIAGTPVYGSISVHARAGIGAPIARPLRAGDTLTLTAADTARPRRRLAMAKSAAGPIRVVLGPQQDFFDAGEIAKFLAGPWRVSAESDRMGYRIDGPRISAARGHNIVSDGIANGSIQIPGDGRPLVLLADRGTTGGYPKIAAIVTADLGRFAQIPAGAEFAFAAIDVAAAQTLARAHVAAIAALPGAVQTLYGDVPSAETLLAANLAGSAVNALDADSWHG